MRASFDFHTTLKGHRLCIIKAYTTSTKAKNKAKMGERRHGENITTANGLFEGFEKSVTNLERKISVKIFKQNYGVLICKYSAFKN